MKSIFTILTCLLIITSCSKDEVVSLETQTEKCDRTTEAIVRVNYISVSQAEFFYFLELQLENRIENVFPATLGESHKVEGRRIKIDYRKSATQHSYVNCSAGTYNATNPAFQTMPIVSVCQASAVL